MQQRYNDGSSHNTSTEPPETGAENLVSLTVNVSSDSPPGKERKSAEDNQNFILQVITEINSKG